ncbi:MAG: hypothetical protein HKP09_03665 [Enterobacterales bacterium]|nr:hypothetical protein [Enterobacterales bacterium]
MDSFNQIIESLVVASVAIGILTSYLTINKIWSRKSDENVAKSVSVFAALLGILSTIPFLIKYGFIDAEYKGAVKAAVSITVGFIFLLIGSGYWVNKNRKPESLWVKFKKAVKLEGHEAGDLVKAMLKPAGADKMLLILQQLALIDNKIDDKEFKFIETFANTWGISSDLDKMQTQSNTIDSSYMELRHSVVDYLNISPPEKQVRHLTDVLNALAKADKNVSEEEKFILAEINSLLDNYGTEESELKTYEVAIAPQNQDQEDLLNDLLPELVLTMNNGGKGYLVGAYHSKQFASMVCKKYRSMNLFTAIETIPAVAKQPE